MIPFESYMKKILEQYPRLDKEEIITGLYTFINSIKIKHPNAIVDVHPSTDTTYQEILFTDANNATLASISFKKYPNANDGIVFKLKDKEFAIKVSDEGHIDLRCDYPLCGFNNGTDEVANTKYVLDAISYNGSLIQSSLTEFLVSQLASLSDDINQRIADAIANIKTEITNEYIQYFTTHSSDSTSDSEGTSGYELGCSKVFHLTDKPVNFGGKAKHDLFISYQEPNNNNGGCTIQLKESDNDNASWFHGEYFGGNNNKGIKTKGACAVVPRGYYWRITTKAKDITIVNLKYRVSSLSECTSEITSWS